MIAPGERLVVEMPGGGGLGYPSKRDPRSVEMDVANGYVSAQAARDLYRVTLGADGRVDEQRTIHARQSQEN
jgi:N-methylhydantoinase B